VYVEEVDGGSKPIEGVGTAVAAFIGFAGKGPISTPTLVTNWTQFVEGFGDFIEGSYLAHSVYGYFNNGGGRAYIVRLGVEDSPAAEAPSATAALPSRSSSPAPTLQITALGSAEDAGDISVEVSDASPPEGGGEPPDDAFKLTVRKGSQEEVYDNVSLTQRRGRTILETAVNEGANASRLIRVSVLESAGNLSERRPAPGTYNLSSSPANVTALAVAPNDFEGNAASRTGMGGLEAADDVTMVVAPDLMMAYRNGSIDMEGVQAVQTAMINHCERMGDRVAILDCPPELNAQQIGEWHNSVNYDSSYAALYYPWIKVFNPVAGRAEFIPPGGHMAGIWARTDGTRGVHKAPANEVIGGAIDVELQITKGEQDGLNPIGVNCIRAFPGRGIRVWGARTLSSDPSWRYINVRRLFNFVEKSIEGGTQWVVFEPNDFTLWQKIKRDVTSFLTVVWRTGALFGQSPSQAFYVKCDEETNPPQLRDLGQVVTEIGIAPVKPAEFVIFRISQYSPGLEA
jgi:hypothetical protein